MNRVTEMGEAPVGRLLVKFSLPTIAMMVVNGLYNLIDRVYIGQGVGTLGLAAITVTFPLMLVAVAIGGLIGAGATTLISISLGAGRTAEASSYLNQAFTWSLAAAAIVVGVGYLGMDSALRLLGAQGDLLRTARNYFSISLAGFLFQIPTMGIGGSLRAQGRPRATMASVLTGVAVNASLAPLFIFGFGWGVAGAALATIIAQATVFGLNLALIQGRRTLLRIGPAALRPKLSALGRMAPLGIPVAAQNLVQIAVFGVANTSVGAHAGNEGIAVVGIIASVYVFASYPVEGIGMGAQALWGYNFGARKLDRVRSVTRFALLFGSAVSIAFALAIQLVPRSIVLLFNSRDPQFLVLGTHGIKLFFCCFFLFGLNWVAAQFFQSLGRPIETTALLLGRNILLIGAMVALPYWLGFDGVMWSGPASDVLTALASAALLFAGTRSVRQFRAPMRPDPAAS